MQGSQCVTCKHVRNDGGHEICPAYPDGIPPEVFQSGPLNEETGHLEVRSDQVGTTVWARYKGGVQNS